MESEFPLRRRPTTRPRATKPPAQLCVSLEQQSFNTPSRWDPEALGSAFGFDPLDFGRVSWPGRWTQRCESFGGGEAVPCHACGRA